MAKKKKKRARRHHRTKPSQSRAVTGATRTPAAVKETADLDLLVTPSKDWWMTRFLPGLALFLLVLIYSYLPTIQWIVDAWQTEPDYSHGFAVIPLACMILYNRTEWFPGLRQRPSYAGLSLIFLAIVMRFAGRMAFADFLDAWSMIPLIAGVVWFLWGFAAMKWALPAIGFLFLMFPLPYQAESMLSWRLQGVATDLSTAMLRVLGQPAVSEGHVIWVNDQRLMVEQACSGMRIFIGVGALAYFWAAVSNRSWIDRVIILASAIPLAILANAIRITLVGLLYVWFDGESARHMIHDYTGYLMIPLAFTMLWLVKIYWEHLYRPVSQLTAKDFLKRQLG